MQDIKDGFGLGLLAAPFYDKRGYGHTGGIDGFQANAFYYPEDKVSIAVTSNGVVYPLNEIVVAALSIYFDRNYELPEFHKAEEISSEKLDNYTGTYSAPNLPIKITISKKENTLIGQGTGQPSFPLEYMGNNKFKYEQAKLEMEFFPDENKMIMIQFGQKYFMERK